MSLSALLRVKSRNCALRAALSKDADALVTAIAAYRGDLWLVARELAADVALRSEAAPTVRPLGPLCAGMGFEEILAALQDALRDFSRLDHGAGAIRMRLQDIDAAAVAFTDPVGTCVFFDPKESDSRSKCRLVGEGAPIALADTTVVVLPSSKWLVRDASGATARSAERTDGA